MSRSRKRTPVFKNACGTSQKKDKQIANRRYRSNETRILQMIMNGAIEPDIVDFPLIYEISNEWDFTYDGRHYYSQKEAQVDDINWEQYNVLWNNILFSYQKSNIENWEKSMRK